MKIEFKCSDLTVRSQGVSTMLVEADVRDSDLYNLVSVDAMLEEHGEKISKELSMSDFMAERSFELCTEFPFTDTQKNLLLEHIGKEYALNYFKKHS